MKSRFLLVLAFFFFCGASLFSLDNGTLTVNNCPNVKSVMVCVNNNPVTMWDLLDAVMEYVAAGTSDKSPFELLDTETYEKFSATGTFLVIVVVGSDVYFIANVKFKNGSATIDFKRQIYFNIQRRWNRG